MSCARGCCATQKEHYRSLMVAHPERQQLRKVTTDVHDNHKVDVTEHWHDRQDVQVNIDKPARAVWDGRKLENVNE